MHVSFYTPYPSDKEFSWRYSFEWVEYFPREAFHSRARAIMWSFYLSNHWSLSNS